MGGEHSIGRCGQLALPTSMRNAGKTSWARMLQLRYAVNKPLPCKPLPCHFCDVLVRPVGGLHKGAGLAVGETVILLHPPLPLVGVSIWMERGCQ